MAEISFRTQASADLNDIYFQGAAQFGEDAAEACHTGLQRALGRLTSFPLLGPTFPGLRAQTRYLRYRQHQIFYDYDGTTVWVIRILHHAMDAGRHL